MKKLPTVIQIPENEKLLSYLAPLSCHSDLVKPLHEYLKSYADIKVFSPDSSSFKYCLWYCDSSIIAFATGMRQVSLKLPETVSKQALADEAIECNAAGSGWYSFDYDSTVLKKWAEVAYGHAKGAITHSPLIND